MPTLDDVYTKFGQVSEAAQLLETELGNFLLVARGLEQDLIVDPRPEEAALLLGKIERTTLGQILGQLKDFPEFSHLEEHLTIALADRNKLAHSFYRHHNFRRNSDEGRTLMLADLDSMHERILNTYVEVVKLSGIDLTKLDIPLPTKHVPI